MSDFCLLSQQLPEHSCKSEESMLLKLPLGLQGVDLSNIATNLTEGKQAM